jgi:hypothetical protein
MPPSFCLAAHGRRVALLKYPAAANRGRDSDNLRAARCARTVLTLFSQVTCLLRDPTLRAQGTLRCGGS